MTHLLKSLQLPDDAYKPAAASLGSFWRRLWTFRSSLAIIYSKKYTTQQTTTTTKFLPAPLHTMLLPHHPLLRPAKRGGNSQSREGFWPSKCSRDFDLWRIGTWHAQHTQVD
eukprot:4607163-Amphidinium_carterae.1